MFLLKFWLPVILWAALIFFLSHMPSLNSGLELDFILRKLAHMFEYFVLALLLYRALKAGTPLQSTRAGIFTFVFSFLYAVSDEIHQMYVVGRQGSVSDVLIDTIGIALFFLMVRFVRINKPFLFCFLFLLLSGWAQAQEPDKVGKDMFVTVLDKDPVLSSMSKMDALIDFADKSGIKTLFVQVYRGNKSWFPSNVADDAPYAECLKKLGQDPLAYLIKKAHGKNMDVHAWFNLLSLSKNQDSKLLKKYGPGILTRNLEPKNKLEDYLIDNQYFLEPGDVRVRNELVRLVTEITRRYPQLDGLQFDYIRYPDVKPQYGYTPMNMERFRKKTGLKTIVEGSDIWKQFKRDQVTELLSQLVKTAKAIRPKIQVSATGCMGYVRALEEAFQDWPSWANKGVVDFVTVMSYPPDLKTFNSHVQQAKQHVNDLSRVRIAVPAYKQIKTPEVFAQQWSVCEAAGVHSCVVFHYNSLLENVKLGDIIRETAEVL